MFNKFCQFVVTLLYYKDQLSSIYIALCVINAVSSLFATVLNTLVMVAITRNTSLHSPSFFLLCTLAFSDFGVGFIVQPLYIAFRVAEITGASHVYCELGFAYDFSGNCFGGLSLLVIITISVDRFLAVYLLKGYKIVVTRKRTILVTLLLCVCAVIYGLTAFIDRRTYYAIAIILGPIFLVVTSLNYLNIYRLIRKHRLTRKYRLTHKSLRSRGGHQAKEQDIDMLRYKRTLKTVIYVYVVFILCYLPFIFLSLTLRTISRNEFVQTFVHVTVTLIFLNSSLNPVLYCWRVPEIRRAIKKMLHLDKFAKRKRSARVRLISYKQKPNNEFTSL